MARADDAESGCSESMSTSDSGRGNSVSEDVVDGVTSAASALRSQSCVTSPAQPKHVHFMMQDGVVTSATNSLDRPMRKLTDISLTSSSLRSFGHPMTGARQTHFSTFTNPACASRMRSDHSPGNTAPRRAPARVSFQNPLYDDASKHNGHHAPAVTSMQSANHSRRPVNGLNLTRSALKDVCRPTVTSSLSKISELTASSAENLSDVESTSTMSGSYVLDDSRQNDVTETRKGERVAPATPSTPLALSPSTCQVLPSMQDSVV